MVEGQSCFFLKKDDDSKNEIGRLNGRYAFLFKLLLWGGPVFAFILTIIIVPFGVWTTKEQYADIADRRVTTELQADVASIRTDIRNLPPQPFVQRVDKIEAMNDRLSEKVETILINQAKIMAQMGID